MQGIHNILGARGVQYIVRYRRIFCMGMGIQKYPRGIQKYPRGMQYMIG